MSIGDRPPQASPPSLQYIGFYWCRLRHLAELTAGIPPGKQLAVATQSEARGSNLNLAPGFSLDFKDVLLLIAK